jgi:hypothetical protein
MVRTADGIGQALYECFIVTLQARKVSGVGMRHMTPSGHRELRPGGTYGGVLQREGLPAGVIPAAA